MKYFNEPLTAYLKQYGIFDSACEYARTNAVTIDHLGYEKGKDSLWWSFSWSNTAEGYGFWANHHDRYLQLQRSGI